MPLNELALNGMANWLAGAAPHLALHSADPGPTGLNETSAARVPALWSPASNGGRLMIIDKVFSGGAALGPVTHVGLWSAPTGGIFYGSGLLAGDQTFNANGVYNITNVVVNGTSGG